MAKLGVNGFGVGVVWLAPVLLGSETGASINDLAVTGASMIDFAVTGASTIERAVIGASTIERISPCRVCICRVESMYATLESVHAWWRACMQGGEPACRVESVHAGWRACMQGGEHACRVESMHAGWRACMQVGERACKLEEVNSRSQCMHAQSHC